MTLPTDPFQYPGTPFAYAHEDEQDNWRLIFLEPIANLLK